jgi:4-amino-4-deoxy-L-arabinose transferase-like glycosyltransferase
MLQSLLSLVAVLPRRLFGGFVLPRPAVRDRSAWFLAAGAIAAPLFFFLAGLNAFPLRDNNEGLYAEIAREMLAGGDWIVPHLDGVPYIEKPPLLYWLQAASMAAVGVVPGAARLVSAAPLAALALGLIAFGRRHASLRIGCLASLVLASMVPLALGAHLVLFDPLLAALFGGGMLCFLHGALARASGAWYVGAVLLALAVLEKGAVALALAVGSGMLFLWLVHGRGALRWRPPPGALWPAAALFVALVLPWHLLAAWRQPGFAWFYLINEHILRFLGRRLPDDFHRGPLWFYLPRLPLMAAPWTPLLGLLPWRARRGEGAVLLRFCQACVLFPLIFFSLSQAKADYYLMVCAPFLALWLALGLDRVMDAGGRRAAWCWSAAFACSIVLLVALPGSEDRHWSPPLVALLALGWLCLLVAGARGFAALASAPARAGAMLLLALAAAPLLLWAVSHVQARAPNDSSRHIAELIRTAPGPARAVFIYRDFEDHWSTLPFYLGRTIPLIDSASRDLAFGCAAAPGVQCIGHDAFLRLVRDRPAAVAVYASRRAEFLALAGPGWRSMAVGQRIVFFSPLPPAAAR